MQTNQTCVTRTGVSEGRRPEEPSNRVSVAQWERHTVQGVSQTVERDPREETPAVATRPAGDAFPVCPPANPAPVVKPLGQRGIQPRHYKIDLGSSDLRLNYPFPGWHLPQEGIPHPQCVLDLKKDRALGGWLQQPEGQGYIRDQLEKRSTAIKEDRADTFTFEPLKTTLENMKRIVGHIGSGKYFGADHPLTDSDVRALDWLEKRADVLLKKNAPYELTVHLCFAFLTVYEVMVASRVVPPSKPQGGGLWFYASLGNVEPDEITAYSWGGNNTTGPKCGEEFYFRDGMYDTQRVCTHYLRQPNMLIYPSFQPLGIGDFCQFGHLPVHPIAMIPDFACNADGLMQSPLLFADHDVGHMCLLRGVSMDKPGPQANVALPEAVLKSSGHRFALRQMLLDHTPVSLDGLKPGLRILQFHLLHENGPRFAARFLEGDNLAFPQCLEAVTGTLRWKRAGYDPDDRKITDHEAVQAALWGARLLCQWRAAGFEPFDEQQVAVCAETFRAQDLPLLQRHLDFIERHRGNLRQMFIAGYGACTEDTQQRYLIETLFFSRLGVLSATRQTLFDSYDPQIGLCNLDNTDLAYFVALTSTELRDEIETCTGDKLPGNLLLASDAPQP